MQHLNKEKVHTKLLYNSRNTNNTKIQETLYELHPYYLTWSPEQIANTPCALDLP